jgi:hypothetical protein
MENQKTAPEEQRCLQSALNDLLSDFISIKSLNYIEEIFSKYSEVDILPQIIDRAVIHMYPQEDTTPSDDVLNGYEDAIFAQIKIYMPKTNTFFVVKRLCDAVFLGLRSNTRIFKDGSTCIYVGRKCNIDIGQAIHVSEC